MTQLRDEHVKHMAERFLNWRINTETFRPDGGVTAKRPNYAPNVEWQLLGTNLFDYEQALAMVRHMVEGLDLTVYHIHTSRREPPHEMKHPHPHTTEERLDKLETEMKKTMADIDTLTGILNAIAADAAAIGPDMKNIEAELQAAQEAAANNQPVDLTNAILLARNAQASLDAIVQSAGGSAPQEPAPAPADTSGGAPAASSDTGTVDATSNATTTDIPAPDATSTDTPPADTSSTDTPAA